MAAINYTLKSNRLLQSRRYTHDTFTDSQEAFTSTLDINSNEVYVDQALIPSSSLPYSGSGQNGNTYSVGGQNVMKYWYRQYMTKSDLNNEVWFFLNPSGSNAGIGAQLIDANQQGNFISPKYSVSALANANTEDATPGYGVRVLVNGTAVSTNNYAFDYKTGVLQFSSSAVAPSAGQPVQITAYQYVGRTLTDNITNVSSSIASISSSIGGVGGSSVTSRLGQLEVASASLQTVSASVLTRLTQIGVVTGSLMTTASLLVGSGSIQGVGTLDNPTFNTVTTTGNAVIGGDLVVQGNTVTMNVAQLSIEDKLISLASGSTNAATANGAGIEVLGANATITYQSTPDAWQFNKPITGSAFTGSLNVPSGGGNSKRVAFRGTADNIEFVAAPTTAGDLLQYDGTNFVMSNTIDGGSF